MTTPTRAELEQRLEHLERGVAAYRLLVRLHDDGRGGVYTETVPEHARAVREWERAEHIAQLAQLESPSRS